MVPSPSPKRRLISSELDAYVVLARLFLVCGLDCDLSSAAIPSVISATSCDSFGGVDGGVSESLVISESTSTDSALLRRGLASVLRSAIICDEILDSGAPGFLGSQGIGLFGSLESQLGIDLCRWMGMLVEKEFRLMPLGSGDADIVTRELASLV